MKKAVETNKSEFRAEARFQRCSPQKAKLVLDMIRGLHVEKAITTVRFSSKRIAPVVEKVLRSAVANAQNLAEERGLDIDVDDLYVKTAVANEGPRMKRIRPAPMGRAFRYQHRIAHIIITVAEKKAAAPAPVAEVETPAVKASGKPAAKKAVAAKSPAKKTAAKKAPAKKAVAK